MLSLLNLLQKTKYTNLNGVRHVIGHYSTTLAQLKPSGTNPCSIESLLPVLCCNHSTTNVYPMYGCHHSVLTILGITRFVHSDTYVPSIACIVIQDYDFFILESIFVWIFVPWKTHKNMMVTGYKNATIHWAWWNDHCIVCMSYEDRCYPRNNCIIYPCCCQQ